MKEYVIEIVIDENGELHAETKGMQGKICAEELDKALANVAGTKTVTNTGDYYKQSPAKKTIKTGR